MTTQQEMKFLKFCGYEKGMATLDYVCGNGERAEYIIAREYVGVDVRPENVWSAYNIHPRHRFRELDIGLLPIVKKDFVIALGALLLPEYDNLNGMFRDISKSLKREGIGVIDIVHGKGKTKHLLRECNVLLDLLDKSKLDHELMEDEIIGMSEGEPIYHSYYRIWERQ